MEIALFVCNVFEIDVALDFQPVQIILAELIVVAVTVDVALHEIGAQKTSEAITEAGLGEDLVPDI